MFKDLTAYLILACWGTFAIVWAITALTAKPTLVRARWAWRIVSILSVLLLLALTRTDWFMNLNGAEGVLWQRTLPVEIVAVVVTLFGLATLLWARFTLAGNWSSEVVIKENHELIQRGPYHWVRHPIYSGLMLMLLGTSIYIGLISGFFILVIVVAGFWFKLRQEEALLTRYFPETYPVYKAHVKALIPFVL